MLNQKRSFWMRAFGVEAFAWRQMPHCTIALGCLYILAQAHESLTPAGDDGKIEEL
jgi:hypothetical protein